MDKFRDTIADFRDTIADYAERIILWAQSESAMHIYSWLGVFIALAMSAFIGVCLFRVVKDFSQKDLVMNPPGRRPRSNVAIEKRIMKLKASASSALNTVVGNAFGLVLVGIVVPGAILGMIAAFQNWFMPGTFVLLVNGIPTDGATLSPLELIVFVIDQSLRGGLSDLFEVFNISLSAIQNNPGNILYSSFTLFYRMLSGVVMIAIFYVTIRIVFGARHLKDKIQMWEEKGQIIPQK